MKVYSTLRMANAARQELWDPNNDIDVLFRAVELAGEVGEACNIVKKLERQRRLRLPGSGATFRGLADELADVVIAASLLAAQCGISLRYAVPHKFNATSRKMNFPVLLSEEWKI